MKTVLACFLLAAAAAASHAQVPAPVTVEDAWVRSTVAGQDSTGAYMVLTAREPLTLVGAQTSAAGTVEIHEMKMDGDVMKMREAGSLPLAPGKPLQLGAGGYHLMLTHLKAPFKPGSTIAMTLRFRDAQGAERQLALSVPVAMTGPAHKP
jgi:copper(I)-binding protein